MLLSLLLCIVMVGNNKVEWHMTLICGGCKWRLFQAKDTAYRETMNDSMFLVFVNFQVLKNSFLSWCYEVLE